MKKVVALLLALATVLAIAIVPTAIVASADEVPFTIEVAEVEGKYYAGDTVSVTLNVTSNPGVSGFTLQVIDNPALVYVDNTAGETYGLQAEGTITGKHQFVFLNAGGADTTVTGSLITLNFTVAADTDDFTPYTVDLEFASKDGVNKEVAHEGAKYNNSICVDGTVMAKANVNEFVGASVELTENFNVVYSAHVIDAENPSYARFTMNGYTYDLVEGVLNDETGYFDYVFEGVAPQAIGDLITAELIDADETTVLDTKEGYSIREYCYNLMTADGASDELKTLLADILVYGAAAQVYADYATDDLVSSSNKPVIDGVAKNFAGLSAAVAANKSEYVELTEADDWGFAFAGDNDAGRIHYNNAYLFFDSSAKLVVSFTLTNVDAVGTLAKNSTNNGKYFLESFIDRWEERNTEYGVDYLVECADGSYELVIPISMSEFSKYEMMELAPAMKWIEKSGKSYAVKTLDPDSSSDLEVLWYGVMSYAYAIQEADVDGVVTVALKDLVKALVNYGLSAEAYVAAIAD